MSNFVVIGTANHNLEVKQTISKPTSTEDHNCVSVGTVLGDANIEQTIVENEQVKPIKTATLNLKT